MAGPVEAWPTTCWGRGWSRKGVAGPVGKWTAPWGHARPRGGVAGQVGAWPAPWERGRPRGCVAGPVERCRAGRGVAGPVGT